MTSQVTHSKIAEALDQLEGIIEQRGELPGLMLIMDRLDEEHEVMERRRNRRSKRNNS